METNTAKLVDPSAIGGEGRGVAATLARSEFEGALKAGKGPVELFLDVKRVSGGQLDAETQTLDIALERRELKKLLKKTSGDAITLTFDEAELMGLLGDVEAHGIREQALVLTVAAATAVAGAGAYIATTTGHHTTTPAVAQAGYLTSAAAQALGTSVQPVSDAATGGYLAPSFATSDSAPPIDAGSALANPAVIAEQTSDAASGGGYTAPAEGGYLTTASAEALQASAQPVSDAASSGAAQTPEQVSDAASGYEAPTPRSGPVVSDAATGAGYSAAAPGGYLTSAAAEAIGQSTQPVSDAASGGGYTAPTQARTTGEAPTPRSGPVSNAAASELQADEALTVQPVSDAALSGPQSAQGDAVSRFVANQTPEQASDAALSGAQTDQSDAVSRFVANQTPEQASDAATGGYTQSGQSDAVSRFVANQTPEQASDAATGAGYTAPAEGGYLTTASAEALQASSQPVSDAATGGYTPAGPEQVSDAASGGGFPTVRAEAQRTGVNLPEAAGAAIAGGIALLITGAALQRRR